MLKERVEIKHKLVTGMMLALILVGVLNVPLTVTEVGVEDLNRQIFDGNDLEPFPMGDARAHSEPLSVAEDPWDFSNRIEWSRFACFNDSSAEVVIGLTNTQTQSHAKLSSLVCEGCGEIVNTVSMGGEVRAVVANIPLTSVSSFVTEMQIAGLSRYIEPNIKFQANFVPNDPYWPQQWGPAKIEADYAWNTTVGDPSVLVAVIDTGIDYNHPDLAGNYVALGYDWVNDDADPMDDYGHGTHCAGIIAATLDNSLGIVGVAQVQIMAEKGLDSGGSGKASDLANAIIHAVDQGADILSNSWGGYSYSNLIHDAVKYAQDHDVLVVAAAGNEASSMKNYPAAYDEVVAVTATDQTDDPASFTSYGKWVDVAAPGVDVYSTVLNNDYAEHSGTSMSCPHAAGVAALIWSEFPSLTADEVRLRLQLTADDLGDAGFDVYYGYGRVNARRAVEPLSSHDLLILNWKRPAYVEPGSSAIINTTVVNFGSNNEGGITVQVRANGSTVDSAYISYLGSVKSVTVSCMWSPTVEGRYYVESYVVPVSGETVVDNNVRSAYINVRVGKFIRVPEDCSKIQEAVDLAGPGETIKVASGTYYESVTIETSLKLVGENRNTTVIDGNGTGTVVGVTADNVEVRGFTVQKSAGGLPSGGGVVLLGVKNCVVTNNTVTNNFEGVTLWECTGNNSVYDNIAFSNEDANIGSFGSTGRDTISDNTITGGQVGVIIVLEPWDPSGYNRENTVSRNLITRSKHGISIVADDNTIVNNTITLCSDRGIWLGYCGNTIRDNRVENNQRGIVMEVASSNKIYHNDFVHNTIQVIIYFFESADPNTWDDGYPSGGNHWSDYKGVDLYSGPCQNLTGSDGIADTPYIINDVNKDRYPLIDPLLTPFYGPTAIFTYSPEKPSVGIAMTFNASASIRSWNGTHHVSFANYTWDFGDENITTVAGQVICHTYVAEGTYTVNLTVTCQDDPVLIAEGLMSDSTWQKITIVSPYGPTANFDYWPPITYVNDTMSFFASASVPGWNGTHYVSVANYTWDFGDENITTTTNPIIEHSYACNRTYTVNLTVTCQDDPILITRGLTSNSTWQNITIRIESLPPFTRVAFEDDFEGYDVGAFPYSGGWELWTTSTPPYDKAEIVDNTPTKSLNLSGVWGFPSVAAKRIKTDAAVIGFEVWVKTRSFYCSAPYEHTRVGFAKKTRIDYVSWYASVIITESAELYAGGQCLMSYPDFFYPGRWYKVRVVLDRPTGTFSVWINDVLKGENLNATGDLYEIEAIGFSQGLRGGLYWTYFDETKIFEGPCSPTGNFDYWPHILYVDDTVTFDASASLPGWNGTHDVSFANYTWDFGDENITTTTNPIVTHAYTTFGTYNVTLTVTDIRGVTGTTWQIVTVRNYPVAFFTYKPNRPVTGDPVLFNASLPTPEGGIIIQYEWDFGDGNTANTTIPTIQHIYATRGTYNVTLTVKDALGSSDTTWQIVRVRERPVAVFIYTPQFPLAKETVTFDASASLPGWNGTAHLPIVSYEWDFGDGCYGKSMIKNHVYKATGTYTVTLNVTDSEGLSNTAKAVVQVGPHDVAITNVVPSKTVVGQGCRLKINVTATNEGDFTETFNVTIYANTTSIATQTVTLASGNSTTITLTWKTTGVTYGNYTISANATIVEGETDTTDNTYPNGWVIVSVVGDVDGDGMVGSIDLGKLGANYGNRC